MVDNSPVDVDKLLSTMVEVTLPDPQSFLRVKETLMRIGISGFDPDTGEKVLHQSCHIFQKRGKYYITHFKELFLLDGNSPYDADGILRYKEEDVARRNTIASLLHDWGLVILKNPDMVKDPILPISSLVIIKHSEKGDWKLKQRHKLGRKKEDEHV